jgi:hypothetical protein
VFTFAQPVRRGEGGERSPAPRRGEGWGEGAFVMAAEDKEPAETLRIPPDGDPLHLGEFVLRYTEPWAHRPNPAGIAAGVPGKDSRDQWNVSSAAR